MNPALRRSLRIVLWVMLGLWGTLMVALQVILNPSFLEKTADMLASELVDGNVSFSKIRASMIKSFPDLNITIDDFLVTYPHERFALYDSLVDPSSSQLHAQGWGEATENGERLDTLAHFCRLSVAVNYVKALRGRIDVGHATLDHPRIFLHSYDSTQANWNIFKINPSEEDKDSTSFTIPPIRVGKISLSDSPYAVFTSIPGSMAAALAVDNLTIKNHHDHYDIDLESEVTLNSKATGTMFLPVKLKTNFHPDFEGKIFAVKKLKASVAMVDFSAEGRLDLSGEDPYILADASIDREPVSEITEYFGRNFPILKKLRTDAVISMEAHCDGSYIPSTGALPPLSFHLTVPDSKIAWEGIDEEGSFDFDITASTSEDGKLSASIPDLCLRINGADIQLKGSASELLDGDPLLDIDASIHAELDSLARFLPEEMALTADGNLDGKVKGSFRISQLDPNKFGDSRVTGNLLSEGIRINDARDSVSVFLGKTSIGLGPAGDGGEDGASSGQVGISASIDSLNALLGSSTFIRGSGVKFHASPLLARLEIASVGMRDLDSCFVGLRDFSGSLKFRQESPEGEDIPRFALSSHSGRIFMREDVNRVSASGISLNVSASPARKGSPEDSLGTAGRGRSRRRGAVPEYLSEKDFEKKDINIKLGESLAKYVNDWDMTGDFKISEGTVISPYFPLENKLSDLSGRFSNNNIQLKSLTLRSGASDISAKGSITGLKRALTSGRGRMTLDLGLNSDYLDLDEILAAISAGSQFVPPGDKAALSDVDDRDYLASVQEEAAAEAPEGGSLFVIPANLNAKVNIQSGTVKYSNLRTSFLSTDLEMKERCIQMTNTMAMTNMGEVFLEGFYSTRTKKDLKAGFDLMLSNITAEKVIQLFPAVDSIMPMLKAFKGLLDCEIATTASLDTLMNIDLRSMSGMIKIDGKDLSLSESEELDKLRKTLMFKDKDSSYIDAMSVRGIIKDNQLEIFPFILKVDRYTLALNGIQQFDQNFKYHFSAIRSPIPFRFGVNLGGTFGDWKWKLGKARYKSTKIPLFDNEIDQVRLNLVNSIHNIFSRGVEQALLQNKEAQDAVEQKKTEISYSADETEDLTEVEKKALKTLGGEGTPEEAVEGGDGGEGGDG